MYGYGGTPVYSSTHTHVMSLPLYIIYIIYIRGNEKYIARCLDMVTHATTVKVTLLNFRIF